MNYAPMSLLMSFLLHQGLPSACSLKSLDIICCARLYITYIWYIGLYTHMCVCVYLLEYDSKCLSARV